MNWANFGFVSFVRRKEVLTALKSVDLPASLGPRITFKPGAKTISLSSKQPKGKSRRRRMITGSAPAAARGQSAALPVSSSSASWDNSEWGKDPTGYSLSIASRVIVSRRSSARSSRCMRRSAMRARRGPMLERTSRATRPVSLSLSRVLPGSAAGPIEASSNPARSSASFTSTVRSTKRMRPVMSAWAEISLLSPSSINHADPACVQSKPSGAGVPG